MVFLLRGLLPLLILITAANPSHADTPFIYRANDPDLRVRQIATFLTSSGSLSGDIPYEAAKTDLNNDGIEEVIFRQTPQGCEASANCLFIIGGLSARNPAHIATIQARKIGISTENAYGVRHILVYNEKQNDFQYITYVWNPQTSAFEGQ